MLIEIGYAHLKNTIVNSQDGDIKGTTTQVEYQDILLRPFLVKTIGQCSRCRLIDNSRNIQSGNDTCRYEDLSPAMGKQKKVLNGFSELWEG